MRIRAHECENLGEEFLVWNHSLGRAGNVILAHVFRTAPAAYTCYGTEREDLPSMECRTRAHPRARVRSPGRRSFSFGTKASGTRAMSFQLTSSVRSPPCELPLASTFPATRASSAAAGKVDASGILGQDGGMLVAFVESIKYVGHMIPIAFLRVFLGYFYFNQALVKAQGDFLSNAYLNEEIRNHLPQSLAPEWYKGLLVDVVIPNWQFFAIMITALYFAIGISYIAGYMVRPFAIIAIALTIGLSAAVGPSPNEAQTTLIIVVHLMLGWLGAGRCLGVDYYFYKRRRGIWW